MILSNKNLPLAHQGRERVDAWVRVGTVQFVVFPDEIGPRGSVGGKREESGHTNIPGSPLKGHLYDLGGNSLRNEKKIVHPPDQFTRKSVLFRGNRYYLNGLPDTVGHSCGPSKPFCWNWIPF